jgi:hypothetical protein
MKEALNEVRSFRDVATEGGPGSGPQKGGKKHSSADIKKAYGILNDPRYKQGNYSGAAKAIDKLSPGLSNHPDVKNAMKRANEEMEEGGPGSGPQNTNFKPLSKNHSSARMTVSTSKAKQIKSWLADNGEQYPVAIDDNGSGQITIDDDDEDGSSYAAGQAIAKKFGVKVMGEGNINEENRFSRQLKGRQREVYDLALKDIRKNKVYGEKDQDAVVDKVAGTSLMGNSLSDVKRAIQHESLDLSATGDTTTSNASQENKTVDLDEAKLSTTQLDTLKQKYSGLRGSEKNGIQMDKLAKIMKRYPESMLDQLAGLDIPMVSKVAKELLK